MATKKYEELSKDEKIILSNIVWEKNAQGESIHSIAKELEISSSEVAKLNKYAGKVRKKNANNDSEVMKLQIEEIQNRMIIGLKSEAYGKPEEGIPANTFAVNSMLKIIDQKVKIRGLEAEKQVSVKTDNKITISYVADWRKDNTVAINARKENEALDAQFIVEPKALSNGENNSE